MNIFAAVFNKQKIMVLREKKYWIQLLVLILLSIGGLILSSSLGGLVVTLLYGTPSVLEASDPATAVRITQTIVSIGTYLLPSLLFAYMHDRRWFCYNYADRRPHQSFVNIVLILSISILPVVGLTASFNESIMPQHGAVAEWMRNTEDNAAKILSTLTSQRDTWSLVANLLVLAVLPGVCEEFLFQGALQPLLMRWTKNPHIGIFLTAFIFSTIHFQFYGFIPRLLLGLYMAYLLYWSKSLWLPILAHILHNALMLLTDYTLQGRGINTESLNYTDVRGAVPLALGCLLITAMGMVFMWRTHKDMRL